MTGPNIDKVGTESQASPLTDDILKQLQGILSQGGLGTGAGPLQREAGTAIQQFVKALQGTLGGRSEGVNKLIGGLEAGSKRRTDTAAADQREAFGITGSRFGSPLATSEALLRSESATGLDQTIGGILETSRQFDTNALLAGISQLFGQGQANTNAFTNLLPLGVFQEEVIATPGVFDQILAGSIQAGSNFLLPNPAGAVT